MFIKHYFQFKCIDIFSSGQKEKKRKKKEKKKLSVLMYEILFIVDEKLRILRNNVPKMIGYSKTNYRRINYNKRLLRVTDEGSEYHENVRHTSSRPIRPVSNLIMSIAVDGFGRILNLDSARRTVRLATR